MMGTAMHEQQGQIKARSVQMLKPDGGRSYIMRTEELRTY